MGNKKRLLCQLSRPGTLCVLAEFFEKLRNYLNGLGFKSAEDIFGEAYRGEMRGRLDKEYQKEYKYAYGEKASQVSDNQRKAIIRQAKTDKAKIEETWPEVVSVNEGTLNLRKSIAEPKSIGDIASAFSDITKDPQEALYAVFFDSEGRIKSIHIHSKGVIKSALIDFKLIAGKALNEGAAKVAFVHNHPSGEPSLSDADRRIYEKLDNLLRGTGVQLVDMIAIGRSRYSGINEMGDLKKIDGRIKAVNIVGRKFKTFGGGESMRFSADAINYIRRNNLKKGLLLLDAANVPVGFVPLTDILNIRGLQQAEIFKEMERRNATDIILTDIEGELTFNEVENIGKFSDAAGVELLDAIDSTGPWMEHRGLPAKSDEAFLQIGRKSGDWRVAPNGNPSHLNKRQWVMVRTPRFKEWFGEWEKAQQYRNIESMTPIEITSPEISKDHAANVYYGLDSAVNKKSRKKVIFVNGIFGKLAGHKEHTLIFRTIPQFKELITNAEPGYFEAGRRPERNNVFGVNNYISKAKIDGKEYYIRFSVQEVKKPDGNELHNAFVSDIEIIRTELEERLPGISTPMTTPKSSPIDYKLTQWLKEVKQAYENSSKVIGSNGEPLVVYHGTGSAEFTAFNTTRSKKDNRMGAYFTESPFAAGSMHGGQRQIMDNFLSIRNPIDLRNVSRTDIPKHIGMSDDVHREMLSQGRAGAGV